MAEALRYDVRPVAAGQWDELAAFFGPSGAYSNCWCAWWRVTAKEFSAGCASSGEGNREVLRRLTVEGRVPGLLAYEAGSGDGDGNGAADDDRQSPATPLGWVSVAPRPQFGRVSRSPNIKPDQGDDFADPTVWAVVCFWVPRANRGRGVSRALLDGAAAYAFEHGAAVVEAYPVDTQGARTQAASIYTGTVPMFAAAGFREVLRRGGKRAVMRRYREQT
jgi:GNAT superfamily N-acetyltransferase